VRERFAGWTLLEVDLVTGRTHQIRVHLKALGHVLLGDAIYGWKPDPRLSSQPARVMLHAEHLVVEHPVTHKPLDLRAAPPKDFAKLVKELRKAAKR
jgi:23S rRNA pseudouridine1911/1915/1917 synthase